MNEGKAVGGPANGQTLQSETCTVLVPIIIPGEPGFGSGRYEFKFGMWIWQGKWPLK